MSRVEITEVVLRPNFAGELSGVTGASVTVNDSSGGEATIYETATGQTTVTQPLTTRVGRIEPVLPVGGDLWVEPGAYEIAVTTSAGTVTDSFVFGSAGDAQSDIKRRTWFPAVVAGILDETIPRTLAGATSGLTSATLRLNGGCVLRAGQRYTHISFFTTVALISPTNQWFCLVAQDGTVLAKTVDDLAIGWPITTFKTLALSAPYTPTVDTPVYLGICTVAATPCSLNSATAGNVGGQTPFTACNSTAALTGPSSLGGTATIGANAAVGWGAVIGSPVPEQSPLTPTSTNASSFLTIQTPDGTGQVVEPAVERVPGGWNGYQYWALISGYAGSNPALENPSVYVSNDGLAFIPAPGAPFPLDATPPTGNNADPEIRLGPDGTMHAFWIRFNNPSLSTGVAWSSSTNGSTWTTPVVLFQSVTSTEQVTGPVVLWDEDNSQWVMWYTDVHSVTLPAPLRRRVCKNISPAGPWSLAQNCPTTGIPAGRQPFEAHVEHFDGDEIHMVTTFCDLGTGGTNTDLHFGVSSDFGLTWAFNPTALFGASGAGWDNSVVYRGDLSRLDDHTYDLWYSGKSSLGVWRWGHTTISV